MDATIPPEATIMGRYHAAFSSGTKGIPPLMLGIMAIMARVMVAMMEST